MHVAANAAKLKRSAVQNHIALKSAVRNHFNEADLGTQLSAGIYPSLHLGMAVGIVRRDR